MELRLRTVEDGSFELDVRDSVCPFPQLFTEMALGRVDKGTLVVITNNPPSARDIPMVLRERGYHVEVEKEGDVFKIVVRIDGHH